MACSTKNNANLSSHTEKSTQQGWWQRASFSRQSQFILFIPLIAIVIFLCIALTSFWHLREEENKHKQALARQSIGALQQQMQLLITDNENDMRNLAMEIVQATDGQSMLSSIAPLYITNHPEITAIHWHDLESNAFYVYPEFTPTETLGVIQRISVQKIDLLNEQSLRHLCTSFFIPNQFAYTAPSYTENGVYISASITVFNNRTPSGILTIKYSMDRVLRRLIPPASSLYLSIWLQSQDGRTLASSDTSHALSGQYGAPPLYSVTTQYFGQPIRIHIQNIGEPKSLLPNILFWFATCLCVFIILLLLLNWRQAYLKIKTQKNIQKESNFRRAIENSTTTGLLALDAQGKIIYANPAFCQLTKFREENLVGCFAPYPFWHEQNYGDFEKFIKGNVPSSVPSTGHEVQLQRQDGELFYVRLYISPLIDAPGQPTGWVITITDISESKRSQEELALAGQRFTTVLEGMDTAISVVAVGATELLFANHSYRKFFGDSAQGHIALASQTLSTVFEPFSANLNTTSQKGLSRSGSREHREIYIEQQKRWVEIRSRYLPWVDGRLAQMLITTDITEQHRAREQAAIQADQTREAGRLMTMGEMASSVAHELNQPLTAIHNYCSGLIRRIHDNSLTETELLNALEKTAKQATRAGKIIQRIRDFVKKSTPNRVPTLATEIVENVQELAEIDARRRNIELHIRIEENLPPLVVDPLLIEQVLLNLARNAVDSIDTAKRPPGQRHIHIDIHKIIGKNGTPEIEFRVQDTGTGLPPEVLERMFEAFFTTKDNGLGIGLNLCRTIIESHGGSLYFENLYNGAILTGCQVAFALPFSTQTS